MRWSRSGAAAAVLATASFVWGCSGSPGERSGAADSLEEASGDGATDSRALEGPQSASQTSDAAGSDAARSDAVAPAAGADPAATASPVGVAPSTDRATYHVPVPAELEPYSNFELSDLRLREHGSEWELEYTLPELLVGGRQQLSFRGSVTATGEYQLLGDAGQVSCHSLGSSTQSTTECDEVLSRVELDREKLERSFAGMPSEESAARWAVVEHFSDDPIGVLTFPAEAR